VESREVRFMAIRGIGEVAPGDEIASVIGEAVWRGGLSFEPGDILVVAQKVISKAEGRIVDLRTILPSEEAKEIACTQGRDPRLVEVILRESSRVLRRDQHVLITETHHGFVCANAGVDRSNVLGEEMVSLLPLDPDVSASNLSLAIQQRTGFEVPVIITDTFGRAWREGLTNATIGLAGLAPLIDYRGRVDDYGSPLTATVFAVADEIAAATGLLMGKTERIPAVLVRGYPYPRCLNSKAVHLIRPRERDLFR
jgi:coenzyme F420-0:L-glutamate ligase/coenzyme F420-1:gamma-L-glutamate ligase